MKHEILLEVIRESITSFTSLKREQIQLDSNMSGDLALDSAERLELVLDMESRLGISIPTEDYSWCKTIEDVITLINQIQKVEEVKI